MTDRLIMLTKPFSPAQYRLHEQSVGYKPKGLWYGCGREWIEWAAIEMPHRLGEYVYRIKVNLKKILRVSTLFQFDAFDHRYAHRTGSSIIVDWTEVAKKYMGIEICPYQPKRRGDGTSWYATWDVASGAIWDLRALLGIERVSLEEKI